MWADLSVVYEDLDCKDNHARRCHLLATASHLGYDALAWNVTVHGRLPRQLTAPKLVELPKPAEKESGPIIAPISGRQAFRLLSGSGWSAPVGHSKTRAKVATQDCMQYTRLTLVMDESSNAHELNSTNNVVQQFDIIAARPMTERFFLAACATLEVDIISLDLQEHVFPTSQLNESTVKALTRGAFTRLPFKLRFQTIGQALQRGVHFEISLAPPLRGRNIIFTSDALHAIHMRAPHDLVNLAALLGLTGAEGRAALTHRTASVLMHGETRKLQKAVLAAAPASTAAAWQVPATPGAAPAEGSTNLGKGAKRKRSTSGKPEEEQGGEA